jgi:hypothetical protein
MKEPIPTLGAIMRNGPITIPDVAGPVTVDSHFWSGKQSVMVDDQRARRHLAVWETDVRTPDGRRRSC